VWKRSWKALAGCAVGLVLFFWIVPGVLLGFGPNQQYLVSWYKGMIVPYAVDGVVTTEHQNQSLPGLCHRLLTDSPSFSSFEGERYVPEESHNLAAWNPALVRGLVRLCMLAFVGCVVWVCRSPLTPTPLPASGERGEKLAASPSGDAGDHSSPLSPLAG